MTADDQPRKRIERNTGPRTGREANSPWQMPWAGWKQVAVRTWKQSSEDNVALISAGVSFYGFLAMVPLLGATVIIYGLVANPQTVLANVKSLTSVMPADAATLIGEQLMSVVQSSGSKKGFGLLIALAIALFGARNAAGSVITALNIAYEEEEKRGLLRVNLLALVITAAAVVLAVMALLAITAIGYLENLVPNAPGFVLVLGKALSYVLLLLGAAAAASTLYRYGPDREEAKWTWITTGSLFAAIGWVLLTLGFGFYASHFGSYGKTYGSLATVVVLLTWMFLSGYVFLFGAELNSEFEHQTTKDTTAGAPRPMGERGAWSADHVAGSDEPSKPSRDASPPQDQPGDQSGQPPLDMAAHDRPHRQSGESLAKDYAASRIANRAGAIAGLQKVGMVTSVLATAGLSLLRQRGRAGAGVALLAGAAGLSLLKRKSPD
jgi:membrane protein